METIRGERHLRLQEVSELTSLGKSTINLWVAKGRFPPPTALSTTIKVWRQSDIDGWIASFFNNEPRLGSCEEYPPENMLSLRNQIRA